MMAKQKKDGSKGFTLLELLIVLAVLAIIAAILIPNFFTTTDRARLRSDIQSARVIQSAMELYEAELGSPPAGATFDLVLQRLTETGFLRDGHTQPQTYGAVWVNDTNRGVLVNINGSGSNIRDIYLYLPTAERAFVLSLGGGGGTPAPTPY